MMTKQNIDGLEAAYKAVYRRELGERVAELTRKYEPDSWPGLCTELNPNNAVPCFWSLAELAEHYANKEATARLSESLRAMT